MAEDVAAELAMSRKVSRQDEDTSVTGSRRTSIINMSRRGTISNAARKSIVANRDSFWRLGTKNAAKPVQYENTYRMEPKLEEKISKKKIEDLLQEILNSSLTDSVYEPVTAQTLSKNLSNMIRKRIREMFPNARYKFVVLVHIGSSQNASINIASRAVWYVENGDTYAEASFHNASIFGVATVFATYFE